jgi:NAD+ kinase
MRIFLLGNANKPRVQEEADKLIPFLQGQCDIVAFDLAQKQDLSKLDADIALVLGGDGAILRAARQMGYKQTPVLGINLGKLGFLADLDVNEIGPCLSKILAGNYQVTWHLMFECKVKGENSLQTFLGLNELVVRTSPPFHMIDLKLEIDGEVVSVFSGDGLIISTPIGSTAYNLSAGGPILSQAIHSFVLTPVCPHTLTNRPLVDSSEKAYSISLQEGCATLIIDGQLSLPLGMESQVILRKAPVSFGLVKVPGHGYYSTLRNKLRWGTGPNYRTEP